MVKSTFGTKLQQLRNARGMSLRQMSDELKKMGHEVSHSGIAKWERGESPTMPRRTTLAAICKLFRVDPSWLIEDMYEAATPKKVSHRTISDLELLLDDEFELLVKIKDQFIQSRARGRAVNE